MAISNHLSLVGLAAAPAVGTIAPVSLPLTLACSHVSDVPGVCHATAPDSLQVSLPPGLTQCEDSSAGASCATTSAPTGQAAAGVASTPAGLTPCVQPDSWSIPASSAACAEIALAPEAPAAQPNPSPGSPLVVPSVPVSSLTTPPAAQLLRLSSDAQFARPDQPVTITATSTTSVTNTPNAIEIFDKTASLLLGACGQGNQCRVSYSAKAGSHTIVGFVLPPTQTLPKDASSITSSSITVTWVTVRLDATTGAVVGPGRPLMVTASSTAAVDRSTQLLQIYDAETNARLAYCTRGTSCSISLTQGKSGPRQLVAALGKPSSTFPVPDAEAISDVLQVTWLSVTLSGSSTGLGNSVVYLTAIANADVVSSPWSIGIFNEQGQLVGPPCKSGVSCSVQLPGGSQASTHFSAAVGAVPAQPDANKLGQLVQKVVGPTQLVNVQARSESIAPTRILWGVDSCKAYTNDSVGNGLYLGTAGGLGWPDFWGRYLTNTICPGISGPEIALAHKNHFGILPIYNDYNCSNVVGYGAGAGYAATATAVAASLGIPHGTGIAVDIEPPGDDCPGAAGVDAGFIQGWFDGVTTAHYVPVYYGNGTAGSEFGHAWCGAVDARAEIASGASIWSFEPDLLGKFSKAGAPVFTPNGPGCPGIVAAWQYQIGSVSSTPDVDQDLASSSLPLWYP